jgi:hypothetical protein
MKLILIFQFKGWWSFAIIYFDASISIPILYSNRRQYLLSSKKVFDYAMIKRRKKSSYSKMSL